MAGQQPGHMARSAFCTLRRAALAALAAAVLVGLALAGCTARRQGAPGAPPQEGTKLPAGDSRTALPTSSPGPPRMTFAEAVARAREELARRGYADLVLAGLSGNYFAEGGRAVWELVFCERGSGRSVTFLWRYEGDKRVSEIPYHGPRVSCSRGDQAAPLEEVMARNPAIMDFVEQAVRAAAGVRAAVTPEAAKTIRAGLEPEVVAWIGVLEPEGSAGEQIPLERYLEFVMDVSLHANVADYMGAAEWYRERERLAWRVEVDYPVGLDVEEGIIYEGTTFWAALRTGNPLQYEGAELPGGGRFDAQIFDEAGRPVGP